MEVLRGPKLNSGNVTASTLALLGSVLDYVGTLPSAKLGLVEAVQSAGKNEDELTVTVIRDGDQKEIVVVPAKRESFNFGFDVKLHATHDNDDEASGDTKRKRRRVRVVRGDEDESRNSIEEMRQEIKELRAAIRELKKAIGDND